MAGYPYIGGVYGGYKDPDNNKKKTFIGPSADKALANAGRSMLNQSSPYESGAMAGMQSGNPLAKTAKGYPNIGLSTPPRPVRQMLLNVPGDNGLALIPQPAPQAAPAQPQTPPVMARNALAGSPPRFALKSPLANPAIENSTRYSGGPAPLGGTRPGTPMTTLKGGISMTQDREGNPTYSMGTQGQDGYGKMTVKRGTGTEANPLARRQLGGNPGLSIAGPADAVQRFNAPVSSPVTDERLTGRMIGPRSPDYKALDAGGLNSAPKYLGADSGLGWKTRLGIYKEQMDDYRQRSGNDAAMNLEAMREAGAGSRALLAAKGADDANSIARKRLDGELALNEANIGTQAIAQQKGQFELDSANRLNDIQSRYAASKDPEERAMLERTIRGLQAKDEQLKYGTTREYDDMGNVVGESIYNKETGEYAGGGPSMKSMVDGMDEVQRSAWEKLAPEQRTAIYQNWKKAQTTQAR